MPDLNTSELENNADPAEVADLDDRDNADKVADDLVEPSTEEVDIQELKTLHKDITCLYETLDIYESYYATVSEYGVSRPVVELMLVHEIHPKKFGLLCDSPETLCSEYGNIGNPHSAESVACLEAIGEGIRKMVAWIKEKIKKISAFFREMWDNYRLNLKKLNKQNENIRNLFRYYDINTYAPGKSKETTFIGISNERYNDIRNKLWEDGKHPHDLFKAHFGNEANMTKEEMDAVDKKASEHNNLIKKMIGESMKKTNASQVNVKGMFDMADSLIRSALGNLNDRERFEKRTEQRWNEALTKFGSGSEEDKKALADLKAALDFGVMHANSLNTESRNVIALGHKCFTTIERCITTCLNPR